MAGAAPGGGAPQWDPWALNYLPGQNNSGQNSSGQNNSGQNNPAAGSSIPPLPEGLEWNPWSMAGASAAPTDLALGNPDVWNVAGPPISSTDLDKANEMGEENVDYEKMFEDYDSGNESDDPMTGGVSPGDLGEERQPGQWSRYQDADAGRRAKYIAEQNVDPESIMTYVDLGPRRIGEDEIAYRRRIELGRVNVEWEYRPDRWEAAKREAGKREAGETARQREDRQRKARAIYENNRRTHLARFDPFNQAFDLQYRKDYLKQKSERQMRNFERRRVALERARAHAAAFGLPDVSTPPNSPQDSSDDEPDPPQLVLDSNRCERCARLHKKCNLKNQVPCTNCAKGGHVCTPEQKAAKRDPKSALKHQDGNFPQRPTRMHRRRYGPPDPGVNMLDPLRHVGGTRRRQSPDRGRGRRPGRSRSPPAPASSLPPCKACKSAGVACDPVRPCDWCQFRNIECEPTGFRERDYTDFPTYHAEDFEGEDYDGEDEGKMRQVVHGVLTRSRQRQAGRGRLRNIPPENIRTAAQAAQAVVDDPIERASLYQAQQQYNNLFNPIGRADPPAQFPTPAVQHPIGTSGQERPLPSATASMQHTDNSYGSFWAPNLQEEVPALPFNGNALTDVNPYDFNSGVDNLSRQGSGLQRPLSTATIRNEVAHNWGQQGTLDPGLLQDQWPAATPDVEGDVAMDDSLDALLNPNSNFFDREYLGEDLGFGRDSDGINPFEVNTPMVQAPEPEGPSIWDDNPLPTVSGDAFGDQLVLEAVNRPQNRVILREVAYPNPLPVDITGPADPNDPHYYDNQGREVFCAERLLATAIRPGTGRVFLVRWTGYSQANDTWESLISLEHTDALATYLANDNETRQDVDRIRKEMADEQARIDQSLAAASAEPPFEDPTIVAVLTDITKGYGGWNRRTPNYFAEMFGQGKCDEFLEIINMACGTAPAAPCNNFYHTQVNGNEFNVCEDCHAIQNSEFSTDEGEVIEATKAWMCFDCAEATRRERRYNPETATRTNYCLCTSKMRKSWLCRAHRDEAINTVKGRVLAVDEYKVRKGINDKCMACFERKSSGNLTGVWICVGCKESCVAE